MRDLKTKMKSVYLKEALGKEGLRRKINEELPGRLYVHLPMSYLLPVSLFWTFGQPKSLYLVFSACPFMLGSRD